MSVIEQARLGVGLFDPELNAASFRELSDVHIDDRSTEPVDAGDYWDAHPEGRPWLCTTCEGQRTTVTQGCPGEAEAAENGNQLLIESSPGFDSGAQPRCSPGYKDNYCGSCTQVVGPAVLGAGKVHFWQKEDRGRTLSAGETQNYYPLNGKCNECASKGQSMALAALGFVFAAGFFSAIGFAGAGGGGGVSSAHTLLKGCVLMWTRLQISMPVFDIHLRIPFPKFLSTWYHELSKYIQLDFGKLVGPECFIDSDESSMFYLLKLLLAGLSMPILMLIVYAFGRSGASRTLKSCCRKCNRCYRVCKYADGDVRNDERKQDVEFSPRNACLAMFSLLFVIVTTRAFKARTCENNFIEGRIDCSPASDCGLLDLLRSTCTGARGYGVLIMRVADLMLVCLMIGAVLIGASLAQTHSRRFSQFNDLARASAFSSGKTSGKLLEMEQNNVKHYGWVTQRFTKECWFFELVLWAQKLATALIGIFLQAKTVDSLAQSTSVGKGAPAWCAHGALACANLALQVWLRPYRAVKLPRSGRRMQFNDLEMVGLLAHLFSVLVASSYVFGGDCTRCSECEGLAASAGGWNVTASLGRLPTPDELESCVFGTADGCTGTLVDGGANCKLQCRTCDDTVPGNAVKVMLFQVDFADALGVVLVLPTALFLLCGVLKLFGSSSSHYEIYCLSVSVCLFLSLPLYVSL